MSDETEKADKESGEIAAQIVEFSNIMKAIRLADKYGWRLSYFCGKWAMDHPILFDKSVDEVIDWISHEFEDK